MRTAWMKWTVSILVAASVIAAASLAAAHHGGSHCRYAFDDKFGTPFEITFKDGRKISGLLFVMGNTSDEMLVEIGDSGTYSSVYLHTIRRIERRKTDGERHILDFTTTGGERLAIHGGAGNVLFFKTSFGIMDILLPDVETMVAPPPAAMKAADPPHDKSVATSVPQPVAIAIRKGADSNKTAAAGDTSTGDPGDVHIPLARHNSLDVRAARADDPKGPDLFTGARCPRREEGPAAGTQES